MNDAPGTNYWIWLVMLAAGGITFAIRLSMILFLGRVVIPESVKRGLRFVPPAVFSAIIIPELVYHTGSLNLTLGNERLLAGILAIFVAWRWRSPVLTVVVGMVALWMLLWISNIIH